MIDDRLTEELASRIMRWRATPDRFIRSGRSWVPRWHFKPLVNLANAFELLDKATDHYKITCDKGTFSVVARVKSGLGKASGANLARTITTAVAHGLGLEMDG
jgi:hypothetical protein